MSNLNPTVATEIMIGPKKCPEWLKHAYKKAVGFRCEQCKQVFKESELVIHRVIRGNAGGTYKPSNCKVLCKKHHKLFHGAEFK